MMFKLTCKSVISNQTATYLYDRYKKSLYCCDSNTYLNYPIYGEDTRFKNNKWLYILLGTKCNLQCRYCIQSFKEAVPNFIPNDVDRFVELLVKTIDVKQYQRIYLWGGEPLVYRKTIAKLIPRLVELKSPQCVICTSTNGILLTEQDLELFVKYKVRVMISDDGFNDDRFIDDKIDYPLIRAYRKKGLDVNVHATLTPNNCNLAKIYAKIVENYGPNVEFGHSIVYPPVDRYNDSIFDWDEASLKALQQGYDDFASTIDFIDHDKHTKISTRVPFEFGVKNYACRFGDGGGLIVDVNGDLYPCNCVFDPSRKLGNLKDYQYGLVPNDQQLQTKRKTIFIKVEDRTECVDCLQRYNCSGRCSTVTGDAFKRLCKPSKIFWDSAFKRSLLERYGLQLLSYEKVNV